MPDFLMNESDDAIAEMMGLSLSEFRGEVPELMDEHIAHLPCGEDDAAIDHHNYLKRVDEYRKEFDAFRGEGTEDGYIKWSDDGVGYLSFQDYVICKEMDY